LRTGSDAAEACLGERAGVGNGGSSGIDCRDRGWPIEEPNDEKAKENDEQNEENSLRPSHGEKGTVCGRGRQATLK